MDYFIGDTHFFHKNIINYANRPFPPTPEGVIEMNTCMVNNWNSKVQKEDRVFHVGDVGLNYNKRILQEIVTHLNGHKILIMGNHDTREKISWWRDVGFEEVYPYPIIYKKWYIISHEPVFLNEKIPYVNIHGHIHQNRMTGPFLNVGVEQTNYTPLSWKEVTARLQEGTNEHS